MAPHGECVVAIDVGGTSLKGAVIDERGRAREQTSRPTHAESGTDAVLEGIFALADELAARAGAPVAVGLAVPGVVDEAAGAVITAANLDWHDVPVAARGRERLGLTVAVTHDVRAAALAEGALGAAREVDDYLLLTLGTGIGAAVVIAGQPYTGAHGRGGELGHVAVEPRGPLCGCGRAGCLEALASAGHIATRYRAMAGPTADGVTAEEVAERAGAGDVLAASVWREALDALALAVTNYATLLDPELVVIGGGMAAAGDALFAPLGERLAAYARFGDPPPVAPAQLGERAGMYGAALAAWRATGADERHWAAWRL